MNSRVKRSSDSLPSGDLENVVVDTRQNETVADIDAELVAATTATHMAFQPSERSSNFRRADLVPACWDLVFQAENLSLTQGLSPK